MLRAFVILLLMCCASLGIAGDTSAIKFPSPDGRFALRVADLKVDLIETPSGKVMVDLGTLWINRDDEREREEPVLVWSADSKWAAYATHGPGYRSGGTTVYYWNGVAFEEVPLPANLPEPKIDSSKVKLKGYALEPLRWIKPGELELANELMGFGRDDGKKYTAKIVVTVELTAPRASVKKVGKTTTEVSK